MKAMNRLYDPTHLEVSISRITFALSFVIKCDTCPVLPFFQRPSLLNIVRFPNEECFDASNQSGTCFTPFECKKLGGVPSSPCAKGLGACCIGKLH